MPPGLEPSDRKFLLTSGAILGALTVVALLSGSPSGGESAGFVSSYSAASDGSKAAYTLLEELGYRVERWNQPPTELPESGNVVLIMADPFVTASAEESSALVGFVRNGGRIVVTGLEGAKSGARMAPEKGSDAPLGGRVFPLRFRLLSVRMPPGSACRETTAGRTCDPTSCAATGTARVPL